MVDLNTLPEWAKALTFNLDRAREQIRRREDLKKLGVRIGASRLFTRKEAEAIAKAVADRAK